jgi:hypothetical protein
MKADAALGQRADAGEDPPSRCGGGTLVPGEATGTDSLSRSRTTQAVGE